MSPTDQQLLDLVVTTDCYRQLDRTERGKVDKAIAGQPAATPRSNIGKVAFYLARRLYPIPPPLPSLDKLARNVMFTAWAPEVALRCPLNWKVALSADPRYDVAARAAAPKIRQKGNTLAVWGVQTQIGAARIKQLAADLHADFVIYQGETADEYATAIQAGATVIVGNPNAWTAAQRAEATARANDGRLAVIFEVYANAGSPWPETASAQGVPVASEVLGVGSWAHGPDVQLIDYLAHTPIEIWDGIGVYLAENMDEESWPLLP